MTAPPSAARQYDWWSNVYDRLWRRYTERTIGELLARAPIHPTDRVLNVGCGTGSLEEHLVFAHPRQRITGVDPSAEMLSRAREKLSDYPNVRFAHASAENLPFEDRSFDAVVSASALHYFHEPTLALSEMKRVLVTSGRLYLLDWCLDSMVMKARNAVLRIIDPPYVRSYTSDEIGSMLDTAGYPSRQVETFRVGTYLMFLASATTG